MKNAMQLLPLIDNVASLPWQDHSLSGVLAVHWQCHIDGDFLLIYEIDNSVRDECVAFVRSGTHAKIFELKRTLIQLSFNE